MKKINISKDIENEIFDLIERGKAVQIIRLYDPVDAAHQHTHVNVYGLVYKQDHDTYKLLFLTRVTASALKKYLQKLYFQVGRIKEYEEEKPPQKRRCLRCKKTFRPEHKNLRMCKECRRMVSYYYDGVV